MIYPLRTMGSPSPWAFLAFAACVVDGRCFIGWRHADIMRDDLKPRGLYMTQSGQGFVDSGGFYWSREAAARIAYHAGQTKAPADTIMSEELWDPDGTPRTGWAPDVPAPLPPKETTI